MNKTQIQEENISLLGMFLGITNSVAFECYLSGKNVSGCNQYFRQ